MADAVMSGPVGDDWQPVVSEVMRYWRSWMERSGNARGWSEACSPVFEPGGSADEGGEEAVVDPRAADFLPAGGTSWRGFSDYEEHRLLMDAEVPELRVLMGMMLARGIRLGGV